MRSLRWSEHTARIYRLSRFVEQASGISALLFLLSLKLKDLSLLPEEWFDYFVPISIGALVLQLLAKAACSFWKTPAVWDTIHELLDILRDDVLDGEMTNSPQHSHRATLFQHRWKVAWPPSAWPKSGWLVPVERSGHTTRSTACRWRAGDKANDYSGVAGYTWVEAAGTVMLTPDDLPDMGSLHELEPSVRAERIQEYAACSFVPASWVEERLRDYEEGNGLALARSYYGVRVLVRGKPWGVIVIDSTADNIRPASEIRRSYKSSGKLLGSLLTNDGIFARG